MTEKEDKTLQGLKKDYPDHKIVTNKKGKNVFVANVQEIAQAGKYPGARYFIKNSEDKVYLCITKGLKMDPKEKERRKKERDKLTQERRAKRWEIKESIKALKKRKIILFTEGKYSDINAVDTEIEQKKQELMALVRKR